MTELANPAERLTVTCPDGWSTVDVAVEGLALVAVADVEPASGFRPTLVVSSSRVGKLGLADWEAGTEALLASRLTGYLLLDAAPAELAGRTAQYRLSTYANDAGVELTAAQWSAVDGGVGLSLTLTCATDDYPDFRAEAEAIAASTSWDAR